MLVRTNRIDSAKATTNSLRFILDEGAHTTQSGASTPNLRGLSLTGRGGTYRFERILPDRGLLRPLMRHRHLAVS